jgi:alpha-galactosidase
LLTTESHPTDWYLPGGTYLDPSVPGVLDLVRQDVARLHHWGYELIKHDFTTFDVVGRWGFEMTDGQMTKDGWAFADNTRTTAEVLYDLYTVIREAAGSALLIGCNTVGHIGAGLFELQRTGDDTSGKHWERTRKMGVNTLAFRMPQHNTFFAADADCVGLTTAVPWEMNRQWLDLLGRSGTPLFVSADPDAVGAVQRDALTEAFARAATVQPPAEPLDWQHTTSPRHWRFGDGTETTYDWDEFSGSLLPCPP